MDKPEPTQKWLLVAIGWLKRRRVPVLLQMSSVECGAACLAMILSYFGRKTRVADCRECLSVGRDGLTAEAIAKEARNLGLRVKAYSLEPAKFNQVPLPVIVHWNFKHFIVVERWSPKWVAVVDPASGRRRLTAQEFDDGFTGVLLTFEPGVHFDRNRTNERAGLRRFLAGLLRTPGIGSLLAQVFGVSILLQFFGLVLPLFTKVFVDRVLPAHVNSAMTVLGLGMVILVLTQTVMSLLRSVLLIHLEARLDSQMMLSFFEHLLSLPFRFFQQRTSGDLLMRLASNSVIREALANQSVSALLDGVLVLAYLVILLGLSPLFALLVVGLGLAQILIMGITSRPINRLVAGDLAAQSESQSYLVEALMGMATVKAAGAEERALDHWSNLFFKHLKVSLKRSQLSAFIDTAMTALHTLSPLMLLWFGASQVLNGHMTLGTMLALNALAMAFLSPLSSLVLSAQRLQLVGAHLDRIADVLEAQPEQRLSDVREAPRLTGRLEVRQVDFQYDANAPLVLQNISLRIEPGQKVALVGRTGSGKSTLARLLLGLYVPTRGEIHYDGKSLQDLNYRTVRRQWGVVLQESFIFSGSIRENIAFNNPAMTIKEVAIAAQLAVIHDDIIKMPMGYETRVDEGGTGLSGGQRQRLSLARALAHQPPMLLLDEATSHLDVVTESEVEKNLNELSCTRVVVAHRLSTVQNADVILVLDQGAIVERGSPAELLERDGHYAKLVQSQFEG
jgi:HlyB family type I secretion system ABC transporter